MDGQKEKASVYAPAANLFDDVDITDDFMFSYVMRDPAICIELLSYLLPEIKIRQVKYLADDGTELPPQPEPQKTLAEAFGRHGIRMDVYLDDGKTIYNIELQTTFPEALPQRARYYQAQIDVGQLGRGYHYDQLRPSYVIFICKFDPFGKGLYRYSFENMCREAPDFALNDEAHKLFFNTTGKRGEISENLRHLLDYMNDTKVFPVEKTECDLIQKIEQAVGMAKMDEDWRRAYMTFEMKQRDAELRGEKKGREEGRAEGVAIGEQKTRAENAKKMLLAKLPVELVAQCSGLSIKEVYAIQAQLAIL